MSRLRTRRWRVPQVSKRALARVRAERSPAAGRWLGQVAALRAARSRAARLAVAVAAWAAQAAVAVPRQAAAPASSYIVCEDFETTAEGAVPNGWTKQGDLGVAADQAQSGTKSLKVGDDEKGPRRIARSASELGAAHWGRLFYRVALPVPAVNPGKNNGNTVIHSTLVGLTGPRPAGGTAEYRVLDTIMNQSKKHNFIYNVQIQNGPEFGHETAYTYDYKDTWTCAEWHVDNTAKNYTLYIDEMDITGVKVVTDKAVEGGDDAELPASFTQVNIGWYNYQAGDGGFTVWIDDLAMNTTRVGCAE